MDEEVACFRRSVARKLNEGALLDAKSLAEKGLRRHPDDGELWQLLGIIAWQIKDFDEARNALETATCLTPLAAISQIALADVYSRDGFPESARAIYMHLADSNPCPVSLLAQVAQGLGRLRAFAYAFAVCQRIIGMRPGHHAAHFGAAYYLGCLGRPVGEYLSYLETALELSPDTTSYRVSLAGAYVRLGRNLEAATVAGSVDPDTVCCRNARNCIAHAFESIGNEQRAADWRQEG